MTVILNHIPSVQGATGIPRMQTQPVGDVRRQPPWSFTAPHQVYENSVDGRVFNGKW